MKPIIYTTIFGNYDEPKPHPDIDADFICFTDNPDLRSDYWDIEVHQEYSHLHPRMAAKVFKCRCPFDGLSLFIDGSIEITDPDILDTLGQYLKNGFAVYRHPSGRKCIETELAMSLPMEKYQGLPLKDQVNHYFSKGFPKDYGLWALGIILRDGKYDDFGSKWLLENFVFTYQDQISFPYLVWSEKFKIDTIPLDQYACFNDPGSELFKIRAHNRND